MKTSNSRVVVCGFVLAAGAWWLSSGCAAPGSEPSNVVEDEALPDCSPGLPAAAGPLDVAIAIDTSLSMQGPSAHDVDGDGTVGTMEDSRLSDRDDTKLAAAVSGIRSLFELLDGADVRFAIVTYSGSSSAAPPRKRTRVVKKDQSRIRLSLTDDRPALAAVLDDILEHGGRGTSDFYAGMRRANRALIEGADPERASHRVVLFLSDSPSPSQRDIDGTRDELDPDLEVVARMALRHAIVFHTFGLSPDAEGWRFLPLGRIAGATGGSFHVVADPRSLACHLASSLAMPDASR